MYNYIALHFIGFTGSMPADIMKKLRIISFLIEGAWGKCTKLTVHYEFNVSIFAWPFICMGEDQFKPTSKETTIAVKRWMECKASKQ